jgi:hypothetical protein
MAFAPCGDLEQFSETAAHKANMPRDPRLSSKKNIASGAEIVKNSEFVMSRSFLSTRLFPFVAVLLGPLATLPATGLEDWTLEEVLQKVEEANGGHEAINSITNVRIRGSISGPMASYDFVLLKKRPNKFLLDLLYKGRSVETGYNGEIGWRRINKGDSVVVKELEGPELEGMLTESDFDGPLIGPAPSGVSRRLVGIERIDRVDYFIVEVDGPRGLFRHYVDSRSFREHKVELLSPAENTSYQPSVTIYDDYERYHTIWVAMTVNRTLKNGDEETVKIHQVEVNPGLLDFIFEKPRERGGPLP